LCGGLLANRIDALYGIVNGTCNYILSEMARRGIGYDQALQEAQRDGLAEADPTLDVGGGDSAHKLAILSSLAFAQRVELGQIPVAGIDALQARDVAYGQELGYVIKLLAIAQRLDEGLALRVRPVFIHREHPLAWVSGPFNAVSVYGHAVGHTMYYGRGAGGQPTASAVVSDVAALAVGSAQRSFECLGLWPDRSESARQLPAEQIRSRYYLRVMVEDHPGVLAKIAAILGRHDISIASVLQHESGEAGGGDTAAVVITTARAVEGDLRNALSEIAVLEESRDEPVMIGIVDEHEEAL
jgi:homoserine dehydrogenase